MVKKSVDGKLVSGICLGLQRWGSTSIRVQVQLSESTLMWSPIPWASWHRCVSTSTMRLASIPLWQTQMRIGQQRAQSCLLDPCRGRPGQSCLSSMEWGAAALLMQLVSKLHYIQNSGQLFDPCRGCVGSHVYFCNISFLLLYPKLT